MATAANTTARNRVVKVEEHPKHASGSSGLLSNPKRLIYYAGLGTLAAVGLLEWPVAAAIGVGVWLSGRSASPEEHPEDGAEH